MATRVEVKGPALALSEPRERVSESRLSRAHVSPLTDSSNKAPELGPGALILPEEGSKPAQTFSPGGSTSNNMPSLGPKPRLTPKPFALEKAPIMRPIVAPKPAPKPSPKPRGVPGKPALTPSGPPKQSESRTAEPPKPAPLPKTRTLPETEALPRDGFTQIEPLRVTLYETVTIQRAQTIGAGQQERPSAETRRTENPRPEGSPRPAEWTAQAERRPAAFPGSSLSRAKSMGFLGKAAVDQDSAAGEAVGSQVPDSQASEPRVRMRSKTRPVSAVFPSPGTDRSRADQDSEPPSQAEKPWLRSPRPLSMDLTARFEAIGLSLNRKSGSGLAPPEESKENMPAAPGKHSDTGSRGEEEPERRGFQKKEPTDAPGKKAEEPRSELDEGWSTEKATWEGERETEGQEVTENRGIPEEKPPVPVPAAAPSPSPSLAAANSQVTKREEENRAPPSGGNIRRRISLLLESTSEGVSSSPGAESSPPATPPSASEVINVGIRQRIKELKVGMPEAKPEPQRRSYQPRPRSSDLTKRFPTEAVTRETLSLSPTVEKTATEMEGTRKGPERENQDQYRKSEDPSPNRSEQTDSKFPEFSRKSMKSTRPVPENLPSSKPEVVNQVARKGSILGEKLPLGPQCESLPQASEQQQPAGKKPDSKARDGSYSSFQTVRASLFENYVVKHKVMEAHICSDNSNLKQETTGGRSGVPELDQGQSPDSVRWERERERERSGTSTSIYSSSSSESFRRSLPYRDEDRRSSPSTAALRDEPSPLVTREVLPKCVVEAVRVDHVFDTIQAVSEKAVSESVPVALEDKAMTLRSRRPAAKDARDSESPSVQSQGVRQQPVPVNAPKGEPVPERSDKRELYRKLPAEDTQSQGASRMAKSRIRTEDSVTGQQAVPERVKVPKEEIVWGVADDGSLGSRGTRAKPDEGPAETKQPSGGAKYLRVGSLFKWRAEALQEKDEYFKKEAPPAQRDSSPDAYNWSSSEKKPRRSEAESAERPSTTETHSLSKGEARTFKQGQTLSTQGKSAVSEFEEFSRAKENEYPSEVPAGDHRRTAASSGNRGTSMRTREDRPANSGAEEVTAPKSLKTSDQDVGLKQRGNPRVRDTPPKEKRKDSEPRATYFALTGQMPDYPLESLGSKTTQQQQQQQPSEGVGIDVAFDDFSVKSYRRWGTQGQVLNLKRNPSLEAAYGKLEVKDLGIEDAPKSYKRTAAGSRSDEAGEETGNKSHMRPKVLNVDAMLYESRRDSPESEKPACPDPQSYQPPRGSREMEVDRVAKGNAPTFRAEEGYRMEVLDIDALTAEYKGMSPKVTDPWQKRLEEDCYPLARTSRGSSQPSTNLDSPSGARTYAGYQPSDLPKLEPQKPTGFVDSYSREERRAKPDYIYPETTRHSPLERNSSLEDVYATSRSSEADWRLGYRKDAPKPSWVQHSETVRDSDHGAGREKRVGYAVDEALDSRLKQRVKEPREEDLWLPSAKPVPSQSARLENDWYIPRVSVSDERHGQESRSYLPRETAASARASYEADARRQSRKKEQELEPHYPEPRKQGHPPAQDSPVAPAEPSKGRQSFPQESGLKRSKSMHRPRALAWGEKKDSSRERSKSSSRKSFGAVDTLDGASLTRMRAHSMKRERTSERGADQLKQCVTKPSSDSKDTDTLVHEADSQYGTWDTGLRTDDSLTPATPTGSSSPSASLRRRTPDRDSALSLSSSTPGEIAETAFPDQSTSFLDSSALKTRVQLSKKRIKRTLPSRSVRLSGVPAGGDRLSVLLENTRADDWMFKDSTEEKPVRQAEEEEEEEEERPRRSDRSPALQPQRVPLFPGMDPSALKAQLRKRTDSDSPAEGSPSSQLPKSPFSQGTAGCRVLPPAGGKENGSEEMSPQWMKELKSKKRLSQYESNP